MAQKMNKMFQEGFHVSFWIFKVWVVGSRLMRQKMQAFVSWAAYYLILVDFFAFECEETSEKKDITNLISILQFIIFQEQVP